VHRALALVERHRLNQKQEAGDDDPDAEQSYFPAATVRATMTWLLCEFGTQPPPSKHLDSNANLSALSKSLTHALMSNSGDVVRIAATFSLSIGTLATIRWASST